MPPRDDDLGDLGDEASELDALEWLDTFEELGWEDWTDRDWAQMFEALSDYLEAIEALRELYDAA